MPYNWVTGNKWTALVCSPYTTYLQFWRKKNITVADKANKKYHKKLAIFLRILQNATSSNPGKRMCSWSFVFAFSPLGTLRERITSLSTKKNLNGRVKNFRYKTVLSEVRVMGRNKVLFIYYSIKPPCYCSFHTPVAQFPIHTVVLKMTFSHLHRCSGLESSQSSPKMPLIPPDPDGSLSPVKPQSLPKSTVSAPLLQCCLLWIHMGSDDLEISWNPENTLNSLSLCKTLTWRDF